MLVGACEVEVFEASRVRLEAIAYRLLGSANDAEDVVQDTFLRWQSADRTLIETPEAWLTKVLTNLCLNRLTSARAKRETYVGQWLPEPIFAGDRMLGPSDTVEQRESVSIAMLTLMERLSARERVVYVLRSVTRTARSPRCSTSPSRTVSRSTGAPSNTWPPTGLGCRLTRPRPARSSRSSSPRPSPARPTHWCGC